MKHDLFGKLLSMGGGLVLSAVSFWNTLWELGFTSFKSLLIGIAGGVGGLIGKYIWEKIKKRFKL